MDPCSRFSGPLFINNLPDAKTSLSCFLFADDCKITSSSSAEDIQSDIDAIVAWSFQKGHTLHSDKNPASCSMRRHEFQCLRLPYPCHPTVEDLGVLISFNWSWNDHIILKLNVANRTLHLMRRNIPPASPMESVRSFTSYVFCQVSSMLAKRGRHRYFVNVNWRHSTSGRSDGLRSPMTTCWSYRAQNAHPYHIILHFMTYVSSTSFVAAKMAWTFFGLWVCTSRGSLEKPICDPSFPAIIEALKSISDDSFSHD